MMLNGRSEGIMREEIRLEIERKNCGGCRLLRFIFDYPYRHVLVMGRAESRRIKYGKAKGKTMSKERQFTAHDAVESKQTGDIQLDKTPDKLTEEDLQEAVGGSRTQGVDEVSLLTENKNPGTKPPTGGG
jgi:hypothetical protein